MLRIGSTGFAAMRSKLYRVAAIAAAAILVAAAFANPESATRLPYGGDEIKASTQSRTRTGHQTKNKANNRARLQAEPGYLIAAAR